MRKLTEMGAEMSVRPYVDHWYEIETLITYPSTGTRWPASSGTSRTSRACACRRTAAALQRCRGRGLRRAAHYLELDPDQVVEWAGSKLAVIDCFGMLDDAKIRRYFELGCELRPWAGDTSSASRRSAPGASPPLRCSWVRHRGVVERWTSPRKRILPGAASISGPVVAGGSPLLCCLLVRYRAVWRGPRRIARGDTL